VRAPVTKMVISIIAAVVTLIGAIINNEILICLGLIIMIVRLYISLDLR
jgi:hypothetical protein